MSCTSWALLAYVWSSLALFKSDIVSFVVLFMILCMGSFVDMCMVVVKFFLQVQQGLTTQILETNSNETSDNDSSKWWIEFISKWRDLISFLMPNVAAKRALFNLKIQSIDQCQQLLNAIKTLEKAKNKLMERQEIIKVSGF